MAKIPESLRSVGIKCSFLNDAGMPETWQWMGGTFTDVINWEHSCENGVSKTYSIFEFPYAIKSNQWISNNGDLTAVFTGRETRIYKIEGIEKLQLKLSSISGSVPFYQYAFYNRDEISKDTLLASYSRLTDNSPFIGEVEVPNEAVLFAVSINPTKNNYINVIEYPIINKLNALEIEFKDKNSDIIDLIESNLVEQKIELGNKEKGAVGKNGSLSSNFSHYIFNISNEKKFRLVGETSVQLNTLALFFDDENFAGKNALTYFNASDFWEQDEKSYDAIFDVPHGAKILVVNTYSSIEVSGLKDVYGYYLADSSAMDNNITSLLQSTQSNLYRYSIENKLSYISDTGTPWHTYSYNITGFTALRIKNMLLNDDGFLAFKKSGDVVSTINVNEIKDSFIDIPNGADSLDVHIYYNQKNVYSIYGAYIITNTELNKQGQYILDLITRPSIIIDRPILENFAKGVADGGYLIFSDREDITLAHGILSDTGQPITISGEGVNKLGIENGHLNYVEQGKPNYYLGLESKHGGCMTFMSCKTMDTGVVFLLGDKEKWPTNMIHIILSVGGTIDAGVRNDDSGDGTILRCYTVLYGDEHIYDVEASPDGHKYYEFVVWLDGELLYIVLPNKSLVVLKNTATDIYHQQSTILGYSTKALWQNANLVEIACGNGMFCNLAMRYAYNLKKIFC